MAGEGVSGYRSDEFESSLTSELSATSGEDAASAVTRSFTNQFKGTKTSENSSGKPAKHNTSKTQTDLHKRTGGGVGKTIAQGQTSSASIRQTVYDEWRRSKENSLAEQQRMKAAERVAVQKKEMEDKENYKAKCDKAVEEWRVRKKEQTVKARKEELRDKDKTEAEAREKAERKAASTVKALEAWKDRKGKILTAQHKEKKREEEEEIEKKKAEEKEQHDAAKDAFKAWNTKKSETLKLYHQKQRIVSKRKEQAEREAAIDKETSAQKAYDAWKKQKAETSKLSPSNSLNSSSSSSCNLSIRPAWRPARSVQYDGSAQVKSGVSGSHKHRQAKSQVRATSTPSLHKEGSLRVKVAEDGTVLKQKTIHVCCQTLQYWCSCPE